MASSEEPLSLCCYLAAESPKCRSLKFPRIYRVNAHLKIAHLIAGTALNGVFPITQDEYDEVLRITKAYHRASQKEKWLEIRQYLMRNQPPSTIPHPIYVPTHAQIKAMAEAIGSQPLDRLGGEANELFEATMKQAVSHGRWVGSASTSLREDLHQAFRFFSDMLDATQQAGFLPLSLLGPSTQQPPDGEPSHAYTSGATEALPLDKNPGPQSFNQATCPFCAPLTSDLNPTLLQLSENAMPRDVLIYVDNGSGSDFGSMFPYDGASP